MPIALRATVTRGNFRTFLATRTEPGPGGQLLGRGEGSEIRTDFGEDLTRGEEVNAGYLTEAAQSLTVILLRLCQLLVQFLNLLFQLINLLPKQGEYGSVRRGHAPLTGLLELLGRGAPPPIGKCGPSRRIARAFGHSIQNASATDSE